MRCLACNELLDKDWPDSELCPGCLGSLAAVESRDTEKPEPVDKFMERMEKKRRK